MESVLSRKFIRNVEDYGWWTAIKKVFAYTFALLYEHRVYRLYKIDLVRSTWPAPKINDLEFRFVKREDTNAIRQIEQTAEWMRGHVSEQLARGSICLVAFDKDLLAGFNLISFGRVFVPLIRRYQTFRSGIAWSDHIAVQKPYRKMGLASELRYRIFNELRGRGIRRLYGGTLEDNIASLKLTRRVGFKEFVDISYTAVLRFQTWRYKRVRL